MQYVHLHTLLAMVDLYTVLVIFSCRKSPLISAFQGASPSAHLAVWNGFAASDLGSLWEWGQHVVTDISVVFRGLLDILYTDLVIWWVYSVLSWKINSCQGNSTETIRYTFLACMRNGVQWVLNIMIAVHAVLWSWFGGLHAPGGCGLTLWHALPLLLAGATLFVPTPVNPLPPINVILPEPVSLMKHLSSCCGDGGGTNNALSPKYIKSTKGLQ